MGPRGSWTKFRCTPSRPACSARPPIRMTRRSYAAALVDTGQHGALVFERQRFSARRRVRRLRAPRHRAHGPHGGPHSAVKYIGRQLLRSECRSPSTERRRRVLDVDAVQERPARARGVGAKEGNRSTRQWMSPQDAARVRRTVADELVDHVAAVGRVLRTDRAATLGLGVLAGDPAELDDRHRRAVGQHHRHLEQHPHLAGDVGGGAGCEGLGAIASLRRRRLAPRHGAEPISQLVDLAGHPLAAYGQGQHCLAQRRLVRPVRAAARRAARATRPARARPERADRRLWREEHHPHRVCD